MPAGKVITSAPARALASWMAARSVQAPPAVAQTPLPGLASLASAVLSTVKPAAPVVLGLKLVGPSRTNPAAMSRSAAPAVTALNDDFIMLAIPNTNYPEDWVVAGAPSGRLLRLL